MKKLLFLFTLLFLCGNIQTINYKELAKKGIKAAQDRRRRNPQYVPSLNNGTKYIPQLSCTGRPQQTDSQLKEMKNKKNASTKHKEFLIQQKSDKKNQTSNTPRDPYAPFKPVAGRPKTSNLELLKREENWIR